MSEETKDVHLCVLCNNKLESKEALKDHFRKHANKEIDGKGRPLGPNGESLIDVTKTKGRGYEKGTASKFVDGDISCDVCGEKFQCNTTAIQHKFRKHPQSCMKYYCPQCGMQFPLKIHRDKHLANHSPVSSQLQCPCNDCGEVFYSKNALEYHTRSAHERIIAIYKPIMTPPPSKKIKVNNAGDPQSVYYCHICGFEYIVKFNLQKHLEKQHSQEERDNAPLDFIKCTTCDALFYSQRAYQNHNMYHKPDDLYVTSEQQRLRTVTRVDQDFDIRRVQLGIEKYLPSYPRRKRTTVKSINKQENKKLAEVSSDEMSPPSSMDTSSESENDEPLEKRLKAAETHTKNTKPNDTKVKNNNKNKIKLKYLLKRSGKAIVSKEKIIPETNEEPEYCGTKENSNEVKEKNIPVFSKVKDEAELISDKEQESNKVK